MDCIIDGFFFYSAHNQASVKLYRFNFQSNIKPINEDDVLRRIRVNFIDPCNPFVYGLIMTVNYTYVNDY